MNKYTLAILSITIMTFLAACSGNELEGSEAEKYIEQAKDVVSLINEGAYADVYEQFDEEMNVGLPVKEMEEFTPIMEESGEFESFEDASVEEKDDFYSVVLYVEYSEKDRVFTITYNEDDEVAGLFIK